MMHLSDLHSVVCQIVMNNEGQVLKSCEEAEHFAVIVKELFLRDNSTASKSLLQELLHLGILLGGDLHLRLLEAVCGN